MTNGGLFTILATLVLYFALVHIENAPLEVLRYGASSFLEVPI